MATWLKKKLEQLSAKLNADDDPLPKNENGNDRQNIVSPSTSGKPSIKKIDNIEELKELIIGGMGKAAQMLGYSNAVVSGIVLHSKFKDNAIENVGLQSLLSDDGFADHIKRSFKSKGIKYKENFSMDVIHSSDNINNVTRVIDGIGVELLTPKNIAHQSKAKLVATEGFTWEEEYVLEPTGKNYFIGRGKNPKIENGPKIHNDIAFIGIEEKNEDRFKINNYVSRAHANIMFDADLGAYKIYRSKFLNNPSHKIKIYNTGQNDFSGISLSNATVPHVLKNGDSICFNDKIVLEFYLLD